METYVFFQFGIVINVLDFSASFEYLYFMGLRPFNSFLFSQCGDRLYKSESDVYRRQILTSKDGPRAEKVKH